MAISRQLTTKFATAAGGGVAGLGIQGAVGSIIPDKTGRAGIGLQATGMIGMGLGGAAAMAVPSHPVKVGAAALFGTGLGLVLGGTLSSNAPTGEGVFAPTPDGGFRQVSGS